MGIDDGWSEKRKTLVENDDHCLPSIAVALGPGWHEQFTLADLDEGMAAKDARIRELEYGKTSAEKDVDALRRERVLTERERDEARAEVERLKEAVEAENMGAKWEQRRLNNEIARLRRERDRAVEAADARTGISVDTTCPDCGGEMWMECACGVVVDPRAGHRGGRDMSARDRLDGIRGRCEVEQERDCATCTHDDEPYHDGTPCGECLSHAKKDDDPELPRWESRGGVGVADVTDMEATIREVMEVCEDTTEGIDLNGQEYEQGQWDSLRGIIAIIERRMGGHDPRGDGGV